MKKGDGWGWEVKSLLAHTNEHKMSKKNHISEAGESRSEFSMMLSNLRNMEHEGNF